MNRGAWPATVHGIAELNMTEQLTHTHQHYFILFNLGAWQPLRLTDHGNQLHGLKQARFFSSTEGEAGID